MNIPQQTKQKMIEEIKKIIVKCVTTFAVILIGAQLLSIIHPIFTVSPVHYRTFITIAQLFSFYAIFFLLLKDQKNILFITLGLLQLATSMVISNSTNDVLLQISAICIYTALPFLYETIKSLAKETSQETSQEQKSKIKLKIKKTQYRYPPIIRQTLHKKNKSTH